MSKEKAYGLLNVETLEFPETKLYVERVDAEQSLGVWQRLHQ